MIRFDILAAGADPTGVELSTEMIQSLLDKCRNLGGGTVVFPPGKYLTGTLAVGSNTALEFFPGAVLLGSRDISHYPSGTTGFVDACGAERGKALLFIDRAENVTICGRGAIDGQGGEFPDLSHRPMLIRVVDSRNVLIRDVSLRDSGAWVLHLFRSADVTVTGIAIDSLCNANNDGIDIDCCCRVNVSGCRLVCGDDAIVLKTTADLPCEDVVITGCIISSRCNAIKFGTESVGDCRNVVISDCVVYDTRLSGITLASVDGAVLCNIIISRIAMRNVGTAFFIRLGNRRYTDEARRKKPGTMKNIILSNITAFETGPIGCSVQGISEAEIDEVILDDIRVESIGGCREMTADLLPEKPDVYPEFNRWGMLPAFGLYVRHAGVVMNNVRFTAMNHDVRPDIVIEKNTV